MNTGRVGIGRLAVIGTAVLSILIILALVFPALPSIFPSGFSPIKYASANPDWLSGYNKRVVISTVLDDTIITDYQLPVTLFQGESVATNRGLHLDGVDDFVRGYLLNFPVADNDFTIECWVKIDDTFASGWRSLVNIGKGGAGEPFVSVDLIWNDGYLKFRGGHWDGTHSEYVFYPSGTSLSYETWYHCFLTYTASTNTIEFSVDNVSRGTLANYPTAYNTPHKLRIGIKYTDFAEYARVTIDELRISNCKRTDAERAAAYNNGNGARLEADANTVALYHFDEGFWNVYEVAGADGTYYGSDIQLENLGGSPEKLAVYYYKGDQHWGLNSRICMKTSTDGGQTWSSETVVYDDNYGSAIIGPGGGGRTQSGAYILFATEQTDVTTDPTRIEFFKSTDGLYSTQEERTPHILIDYDDWSYGAFTTAHMIYIPTKGLMQAININTPASPFEPFQIAAFWSPDDGDTWGTWDYDGLGNGTQNLYSVIATDATRRITEPSFVYLGDGKILGLIRTDAGDGELLQVTSSDYGEMWSALSETGWKTMGTTGSMIKFEIYGESLFAVCSNRQTNQHEIKIVNTDVAWNDAKAWQSAPTYAFNDCLDRVNNWVGYNSAVLLSTDSGPSYRVAFVMGANSGETGQRLMFAVPVGTWDGLEGNNWNLRDESKNENNMEIFGRPYRDAGWVTGKFSSTPEDGFKGIYLNDNCLDAFTDIRFTKLDGTTELYYYNESKTDSISAIFAVNATRVGSSKLTGDSGTNNALDVADGSVFAANDYVLIRDDDHPDGEVNKITNISTNHLTFQSNFEVSYLASKNARVCHGIFMYYDKPSQTSHGSYHSGADTFVFFDDAETGDATDLWNENDPQYGNVSYEIAELRQGNKSLFLEQISNTDDYIITPDSFTPLSNLAISFWLLQPRDGYGLRASSEGAGSVSLLHQYGGLLTLTTDDFEWGSDGDNIAPSGGNVTWTSSTPGSSTVKIDTGKYHLGTRSVEFYRDGTNDAWAQFAYTAGYNYEVSFWVNKDDTPILNFYHGNNAKTINFGFWSDEQLDTYNGTTHTKWGVCGEVNTWVHFELKNIDWDAGTYDVWVDGVKMASGAAMRPQNYWNNIMRFFIGSGAASAWVDDVEVVGYHNRGLVWNDGIEYQTTLYEYTEGKWTHYSYLMTAGDDSVLWKRDGVTISPDSHYESWSNASVLRLGGNPTNPHMQIYVDGITVRKWQPTLVYEVASEELFPTLPTLTTQACDNIQTTQVTAHGTITDTGGQNAHTRGFCYMEGDSGDPTTLNSTVYDNGTGSYGAGAYSKSITGLSAGTSSRVRAYATNDAGTGYGDTITVVTLPDPPTNVAATDGDYTDKVTITWTKSTGATGYKVYEGPNLLDTLGDVATYDDTAAPAPTITPGTASATDGDSTAHVTLSVSGESANNGASRTYKVKAFNDSGDSADSGTDTGFRGVGALTYQWYVSASDSDGDYSILGGATTDPYDDTSAPAPTITPGTASATDGDSASEITLSISGESTSEGVGRYYKCYISAAGASSQYSTANRGYRTVGSLNYQWYRSAGDSDDNYSTIDGATSSTHEDTDAPAPTVTAGSASASDGISISYVTLTLTGQSGNNGEGRYYKCGLDAEGAESQNSTSDRGYRGASALGLQWQRSAADSDDDYSDIPGATVTPYNDTGGAVAPDGRYYQCTVNMTDAISQNSTSNRGYMLPTYAPVVASYAADHLTGVSGTLHGSIDDTGNINPTVRGFEWGLSSGNYTFSWNETGSFGIGGFSHTIDGLSPAMHIFWRAFAINAEGQGNSAELDFITPVLPTAPTNFTIMQVGNTIVSISWAKGISADTTVIRGSSTSYPASVTSGYLVYSGNDTSVVVDGLNLDVATYYYRAWSQNGYGYSEDYAEGYAGNPLGIPTIMFVVGLCGFAIWKKDWIRVLLAICVVTWGTFAMPYDIKIGATLLAVGTVLFFLGILQVIKQRREEAT